MRAPRLVAVATVALGAGLVSGSATQVAALDGDLQRAVEDIRPAPGSDPGRTDGPPTKPVRCLRHRDRATPPPGRST
jgi:hypothetical protein